MEKDKFKEGKAKELSSWAEKIQQRILKRADKLEEGDIQDLIHELNTHHINLEMQNEELRKAKAELEKVVQHREQEVEKLKESEKKHRLMIENLYEGIWHIDKEAYTTYVNARMGEILGYTVDEMVGKHLFEFMDQKGVEICEENLQRREKGIKEQHEFEFLRKDGSRVQTLMETAPILDEGGNFAGALASVMDISERKNMEEGLRESKERLEKTFQSLDCALFILDSKNPPLIVDSNPAASKIFGYGKHEIIGKSTEFLHINKQSLLKFQETLYPTIESQGYFSSYEFRMKRKNGEIFPTEHSIFPMEEEQGNRMGWISVVRDISERKKAEEKLRESEEKFRNLAEQSPNMIFINKSGKVVYVNEKSADTMGYRKEEFYSPDFEFVSLIDPEYKDLIKSNFKKHMSGEDMEPYEYRLIAKDGKQIDALINTKLIEYEGDRAILGIVTDISEQRKAQEWLRESEEHFRSLVTAASDCISMTDLEGNLLFVNDAGASLLGFDDSDEIIGKNTFEFISEESMEAAKKVRDVTLEKEGVQHKEYSIVRKDGQKIPIEISTSLIKDAEGRPFRIMAISRDITERKQAESDLRKALSDIEALKEQLYEENIYLREEIKLEKEHEEFIGQSHAIKSVLAKAEQVAGTDSTVLILGETGTGKELLAHTIHKLSTRKDRPLVKVNCAALPPTLIESELFGHEKGAFTGALSKQVGRFEVANGGTLFLDEISELSPELQVKLLRVLQEGQFERVGSSQTIKVDVRIITATNQDIAKAVQDGNFRKDLYYRLNVFPITVPPLRHRIGDIPLLAWSFVKEYEKKMGKRIESIPPVTMKELQSYDWPGNIRELRNAIERAMILTKGCKLKVDLQRIVEEMPKPQAKKLEDMERQHIVETLNKTNWRISGENGAADALGLKPTTLHSKMAKLGIKRKD
jgi:PAS domain S-box-containing protein